MQSGLGLSSGIPGCGFCSWKMGFTSCYLRLYSRGTPPWPSPGAAVMYWCFQKTWPRPRRLSCPGTKMRSGAWLSAVHSLATHCGSKYTDRCPLSGALAAGDTKNRSPDPGALITASGSGWRAVYLGDMLREWEAGRSYSSKWGDIFGSDPLAK